MTEAFSALATDHQAHPGILIQQHQLHGTGVSALRCIARVDINSPQSA
jgi:hypothetical protein